MAERRWPWVVTSVLLLAAGVAAGWATYLHWLPCRGSLLSGSVVHGYRYGQDFSDACLRRMDAGLPFHPPPELSEQAPWASGLSLVAMVLAGAAWLVLVLGMRWSLRTKAVSVLPGVATLTLAAVSAVATADPDRGAQAYAPGWLLMVPEAAALVAMVAIMAWEFEGSERDLVRVLVVAWGTTAFGVVHMLAEYLSMVVFSDANWDVPPLTGYITVATLIVAAVLTLTLALRERPASGMRGRPLSR